MTEKSVAPPEDRRARRTEDASSPPPSTRELVADAAFCEVLAQDLGLKVSTVRTALISEPKVRCIRVVEWLLRTEPDDAERRGKVLIWWAKKRKAGTFRDPDEDAEREIARRIALYWQQNPERLAETLREAMNGTGAA